MQSQKYYYCNIEGLTDVGCKRPANEDWFDKFECSNGLVAVVCDGMGGHVGGAVASHTAVEAIRAFLENNFFDRPNEAIIAAVNAGNQAILQRAAQQPELTGMGATCVILIVRDGYVYYGSVGDSRIYLVRQHRITQLTKDQSYVQMLVDRGDITPEEAEHHPRKNEITNALGLPQMTPAVVRPEPIEPEAGDCFILCSDGLSGMVPDQKILEIAGNQAKMTQRERVERLIEKARANGGLDNITSVMVEFSLSPFKKRSHKAQGVPTTTPPAPRRRLLLRWLPVALLCIVAAGGAAWWMLKGRTPEMLRGDDYIKTVQEKEKDAQFVKVCSPDSIPLFTPGKAFMTITESPSFGSAKISWTSAQGRKMEIKGLPSGIIKTLEANPAESVALKASNDTTRVVCFKQSLGTFGYVSLVFKDPNGRHVHYVFNVAVPQEKEAPMMPQDEKKIKQAVKDVQEQAGKKRPDEKEKATPVARACTVHINPKMANAKGEINIGLQTGEGRSSATNIYVGNQVKFSTKGNNVHEECFHVSCPNENVVNVTVFCNKMNQKQENIEIFLTDKTTYTLTVIKD